MSSTKSDNTAARQKPWWRELRLSPFGRREKAVTAVLSEYRPIGFVPVDAPADAPVSSIEDLVGRIEVARLEEELQRTVAVAEGAAKDRADFESAFRRPDADEPVTDGDWAGFTHGEAAAWCWNLFHYEPRGGDMDIMITGHATKRLREGGLPGVLNLPERARELRDTGLTARSYREHREALGEPTVSARRAGRRA